LFVSLLIFFFLMKGGRDVKESHPEIYPLFIDEVDIRIDFQLLRISYHISAYGFNKNLKK